MVHGKWKGKSRTSPEVAAFFVRAFFLKGANVEVTPDRLSFLVLRFQTVEGGFRIAQPVLQNPQLITAINRGALIDLGL